MPTRSLELKLRPSEVRTSDNTGMCLFQLNTHWSNIFLPRTITIERIITTGTNVIIAPKTEYAFMLFFFKISIGITNQQ